MLKHLIISGLLVVGVGAGPLARAQEQFNHGDIFVSLLQGEGGCDFGAPESIVRIDPQTGAASVFATRENGLCSASGLQFTPDAQRLAVTNYRSFVPPRLGSVMLFDPGGAGQVVLDGDDGLFRPFGANALAFDTDGDLYVVNTATNTIVRFPGGSGPGIVFADADDGIRGRGALDFAANGDLFYCGDLADAIIRITPDGVSLVFDPIGNPYSLVFDHSENLFVVSGPTVYRYDNVDANSRQMVATGFLGSSGEPKPLAFSPDENILYLALLPGLIYAIDPQSGASKLLVDLADSGNLGLPRGMTVYVDPCVFIDGITPDCNGNGIPDMCDVTKGVSLDCGEDGVPDECPGCYSNCDCDDFDVCTFDQCIEGVCANTPVRYADVAGSSGVCGPDGVIDLLDLFAVLDGFRGFFTEGCSPHNIDITGETHCVPDRSIDLHDILAYLDAFAGKDECSCGP